MLGKTVNFCLLKRANHHQVHHAADDLGTVFNRLGAAQLAAFRGQVDHRAAQLIHASFETHARAGRGFFKNHRHGAVDQRLVFFVGLEFLFNQGSALKQIGVFSRVQVAELQKVFDGLIH